MRLTLLDPPLEDYRAPPPRVEGVRGRVEPGGGGACLVPRLLNVQHTLRELVVPDGSMCVGVGARYVLRYRSERLGLRASATSEEWADGCRSMERSTERGSEGGRRGER